ncbi:Glu/Leu/Phe/Val family dehydrogenase [Desulfogranum japonicum]|uniref:Glu/Leu/Phe/Val family dehydrogenase n=1 Tax=Desulfogranum japonicum TaxID=231447 RepID=UPI00040D83F3|nr:Glu/Leu/Phe/Val dehydrogenase [Desulfogranum japonicum]
MPDNAIFALYDKLGPAKIISIHEPRANLRGILVIDNVAVGPSIGGLRMAEDVSVNECARLARAMTLKNAAAGLPHGGGKSVIYGDPAMERTEKENIIRCFAHALRNEHDYIFGPDMGTNEETMAWIQDQIGRAVGLPAAIGGIPLDEIGATGWGLVNAIETAQKYCGITLTGARVVVQGFGAVGRHAARFLTERGAVLIGASDSRGSVYAPEGLDVKALIAHKDSGGTVKDFPEGEKGSSETVIDIPCDIWIPAARPDVLHKDNIHRLQCKLVAQGANIPLTLEAEKYLHNKGILSIPDFIANAGGVICAAMEYQGQTQDAAMQTIAKKIQQNTNAVLEIVQRENLTPREAAMRIARNRIEQAMGFKRWNIL